MSPVEAEEKVSPWAVPELEKTTVVPSVVVVAIFAIVPFWVVSARPDQIHSSIANLKPSKISPPRCRHLAADNPRRLETVSARQPQQTSRGDLQFARNTLCDPLLLLVALVVWDMTT